MFNDVDEALEVGLVDVVYKNSDITDFDLFFSQFIHKKLQPDYTTSSDNTKPIIDIPGRALTKQRLRGKVDDDFFGTEELRLLDIQEFATMIMEKETQTRIKEYITLLSNKKKNK